MGSFFLPRPRSWVRAPVFPQSGRRSGCRPVLFEGRGGKVQRELSQGASVGAGGGEQGGCRMAPQGRASGQE
eukprot:10904947-Lingulodinium_polyedra.AAC.1